MQLVPSGTEPSPQALDGDVSWMRYLIFHPEKNMENGCASSFFGVDQIRLMKVENG